jgi:hypothetical protein
MGLLRLFNVIRGLNNGIQDEFIRNDELSDMSNVDIEKGIIKKRPGLVKVGDGITTVNSTVIDNLYTQSGQLLTVLCQNDGTWYQLNRDVISIFSNTGENINVVFNRKGVNYNYKHFGILNDMVNGNRPKIKSISTNGFIERLYYYDHDHDEFMGVGVFTDDIESMLDTGGNYKGIPFIDNSINIDHTGTKDFTQCRFVYDGSSYLKLYNRFGKFLDKINIGADSVVSVTTLCKNSEPADINKSTGVTIESDVTTDATEITIRGLNMSSAYTSWQTTLSGTTKVTVGTTGIRRIKSIYMDGTRAGTLTIRGAGTSTVITTIATGITNKIYDGYRKYVITGKHSTGSIQAWQYSAGFTLVTSLAITNMGKQRIVRTWGQQIAVFDEDADKIRFYTFNGTTLAATGVYIKTTLEDMDGLVYAYPDNTNYPALVTLTNASIIVYKGYYNDGTLSYTQYTAVSKYAVAFGYNLHSVAAYFKNIYSKSLIIYLLANRYANIASFADGGSGTVLVTTKVIHNFNDGDSVTITGTTNYNGTFTISDVTDCCFKITDTWVSNDAAGVANRNVMTVIGFDLDTQKVFSQRDVCDKDPTVPDENLMITRNDNESGMYRVAEIFTPEIANLQTVAAAGAATFNGYFGIAFETSSGDRTPPTNIGKAIGNDILIYNIPAGITGVVKRHICYYDSTNDNWNIIYTIDDNTTTSIILNTLALGEELPVKHFFNINAVDIGTRQNRLVVLGRQKDRFTWYYTEVNEEYIGPSNYEICQEIEASDFAAMIDTTNASYLFTNNSVWRVSGYDSNSFAQDRLVGNVGVHDKEKIQVIKDVVYFVAKDGVYVILGGQLGKVSENIRQFVETATWEALANNAQTGSYRGRFCIYGQIRETGYKSLLMFDTDTNAWTIYDFTVDYDFFIVSADTEFYTQMFFVNSQGTYSFSKFAIPKPSANLLESMWVYTESPNANPSETLHNGYLQIVSMDYTSEAVGIKNTGASAQVMTGWMLVDNADNKYTFPTGFSLAAGATVTVHSGAGGSGTNTATDLYWGTSHVWNTSGDTAFLIRPYVAPSATALTYEDDESSFTAYIETKKFTFDNPTYDRVFTDIYSYCKDTDATITMITEVANVYSSTSFTLLGTNNKVVKKMRPTHGHGNSLKLKIENSDNNEMEIYGFEIQSIEHSQQPQ